MVGDELLDGRVRETNSLYLQGRLAAHRIAVGAVHVVPDEVESIRDALALAAKAHAAVVVCGGLGPTPDDVSREALALLVGEELVLDPDLVAGLEELFRRRGREMPRSNRRQALRTPGGEALANPRGTAPGLWHELEGVPLILLPGVPAELEAMWERTVEPRLVGRLPASLPPRLRLRLVRVPESYAADRVAEVLAGQPDVDVAFCAHHQGVDLLLRAVGPGGDLEEARRLVTSALGDHLYAVGDARLPEVLLEELARRGESLAVAESCTGGLLSTVLTDVPGSSRAYRGGVVAYANEVKTGQLGVDPVLLERHGAVSEAVAEAMARGARERLVATWALATTGIAGPGGGTPEKPVGTTCLALAGPDGLLLGERLQLTGDREQNRHWAVAVSLDLLRRHLHGSPSAS